jgi:hypothetical protein
VSSFHLRRLATVATAASLALMLLGTASSFATTPAAIWGSTSPGETASSASPAATVAGGTVWFESTWQNNSTSTLSSLFLNGTADGTVATYGTPTKYAIFATVNGVASKACAAASPLSCQFKNVKPGVIVQVAVVYRIDDPFSGRDCPFGANQGFNNPPTTTVSDSACTLFQWSSTGSPSADPGASHGDTWNWYDAVKISTDTNYNGQFALDITSVSNGQIVGTDNPQATVAFLRGASQIPVTVLDGDAAANTSCSSVLIDCTTDLWGEWSIVSVNNGNTVDGLTLYEFQITFDSSEIKNGVNQNNIQIYHAWTSPTAGEEVISATCTPTTGTPTNVPCLTVKKLAGGDLQVTIWSKHNGSLKGAV